MPSALSKDLRWRIVKKSVMHELTANSIADHLDVPASTVKKVLRRWRETGSVETHQGRRLADAHNTIMTHEQSMRLLELVTLLVCCVHLPAAGLGESPRSLSGGVFGDSSTLLAVS